MNEFMNTNKEFFRIIYWLMLDIKKKLSYKYFLNIIYLLISSSFELLLFILIIRYAINESLNHMIILTILLLLIVLNYLNYNFKTRLLKFAELYEKKWGQFLEESNQNNKKKLNKNIPRQLNTILRNFSILIPNLIMSGPIIILIIFITPEIVPIFLIFGTIGLFSMIRINKQSSLNYKMLGDVSPNDKVRDLEKNAEIYSKVLHSNLLTNYLSSTNLTVALIIFVYFFYIGLLSVEETLLIIILGRFAFGKINASLNALTNINRFFSTLKKLSYEY